VRFVTSIFWFSAKSVGSGVFCSFYIGNSEVIGGEGLGLPYLSLVKFFCYSKVDKVLVIRIDLYLVFRSL